MLDDISFKLTYVKQNNPTIKNLNENFVSNNNDINHEALLRNLAAKTDKPS